MRVRMKENKTAAGETGIYRAGAVVDVSDEEGQALIAANVAIEEPHPDPAAVAAQARAAAEARVQALREQLEAAERELGEGESKSDEPPKAPKTETGTKKPGETATGAGHRGGKGKKPEKPAATPPADTPPAPPADGGEGAGPGNGAAGSEPPHS